MIIIKKMKYILTKFVILLYEKDLIALIPSTLKTLLLADQPTPAWACQLNPN